ncbi:MAG: phosphoribosyltransferase [Opitutae bacterium]|nr:phosphoribosyltransferase [Opitutae bacterium]
MNTDEGYFDRRDGGRVLAPHVADRLGSVNDALVLGLARGGVPVACEVALRLDAELDVFVVRKIGAPGYEEFAIGAIATGGFRLLNYEAIAQLGVSDREVTATTERETREIQRREKLYRAGRPAPRIGGRVVVLVDDGLATGFSMRAAIRAVQAQHPRRLVVAVPVGAPDACAAIKREADLLVCPFRPEEFHAVGRWYRDFGATSDDEVVECLRSAARHRAARARLHGL